MAPLCVLSRTSHAEVIVMFKVCLFVAFTLTACVSSPPILSAATPDPVTPDPVTPEPVTPARSSAKDAPSSLAWPAWPAVLPDDEGLSGLLPPGYDFEGVKATGDGPTILRADLDGDGRLDAAFVIEADPTWSDDDESPCTPRAEDCHPRGGPRTLVIALQREGALERALENGRLIDAGNEDRAFDAFTGMRFDERRRLVLDFEDGVGVEATTQSFELGWRDGAFVLVGYASGHKVGGEHGWVDATHHSWIVDYEAGTLRSFDEGPDGQDSQRDETFAPCRAFVQAAALRGAHAPSRCPGS